MAARIGSVMSERRLRGLGFGLDRFSGAYLWVAFLVTFGVWRPRVFLTQATMHTVASEQAITAMLGIAVLVPLCAGVYDLSVGATVNLAAVLATWLQDAHGWSVWAAIGAAIAASVVVGLVNSLLVVTLRVSSFIATLGMATVVTAVQEIASGNSQPLPPTSASWNQLTQRQVFGFQIVVVYLLVLAVVIWWLLTRTPAGRYLYAIGGNPVAARLSGINVNLWTRVSLLLSAAISGVAGVLYASQNGPSLTFGSALLLPAFAAAFLGSTQITPGRFNVWGALVAVYALATGVAGLQLVTGVQWLNDMFNGLALLTAVSFAAWQQQRGQRPQRRLTDPTPLGAASMVVPDESSSASPGAVVDHPRTMTDQDPDTASQPREGRVDV
jgi:ribose transport system permease protein